MTAEKPRLSDHAYKRYAERVDEDAEFGTFEESLIQDIEDGLNIDRIGGVLKRYVYHHGQALKVVMSGNMDTIITIINLAEKCTPLHVQRVVELIQGKKKYRGN